MPIARPDPNPTPWSSTLLFSSPPFVRPTHATPHHNTSSHGSHPWQCQVPCPGLPAPKYQPATHGAQSCPTVAPTHASHRAQSCPTLRPTHASHRGNARPPFFAFAALAHKHAMTHACIPQTLSTVPSTNQLTKAQADPHRQKHPLLLKHQRPSALPTTCNKPLTGPRRSQSQLRMDPLCALSPNPPGVLVPARHAHTRRGASQGKAPASLLGMLFCKLCTQRRQDIAHPNTTHHITRFPANSWAPLNSPAHTMEHADATQTLPVTADVVGPALPQREELNSWCHLNPLVCICC
jgi:hypothetical protein